MANSSNASTVSTNAGSKTPPNTATIASEAVLRAKTAQMTQPASRSCPFNANFVTPLIGDKVGFNALMERYSPDQPRLAELEKLSLGTTALRFYGSIRGGCGSFLGASQVSVICGPTLACHLLLKASICLLSAASRVPRLP